MANLVHVVVARLEESDLETETEILEVFANERDAEFYKDSCIKEHARLSESSRHRGWGVKGIYYLFNTTFHVITFPLNTEPLDAASQTQRSDYA